MESFHRRPELRQIHSGSADVAATGSRTPTSVTTDSASTARPKNRLSGITPRGLTQVGDTQGISDDEMRVLLVALSRRVDRDDAYPSLNDISEGRIDALRVKLLVYLGSGRYKIIEERP